MKHSALATHPRTSSTELPLSPAPDLKNALSAEASPFLVDSANLHALPPPIQLLPMTLHQTTTSLFKPRATALSTTMQQLNILTYLIPSSLARVPLAVSGSQNPSSTPPIIQSLHPYLPSTLLQAHQTTRTTKSSPSAANSHHSFAAPMRKASTLLQINIKAQGYHDSSANPHHAARQKKYADAPPTVQIVHAPKAVRAAEAEV